MENDKIFLKYRKSTFTLVLVENNSLIVHCVPGMGGAADIILHRGHGLAFVTDIVEGEAFYHL